MRPIENPAGECAAAAATEHLDVLIVGAGVSGIDAAYRLQTLCPTKSYCILEARDTIGGTWDLFRYPGVRSDSDMHTLGFPFRPWRGEKSIVDGPSIRQYVEDTAGQFGIDRKIRFGHRAVRASWCSAQARWTVGPECEPDRRTELVTCGFLYMCSGYYDYASGHAPAFPGMEQYKGRLVHPQHWPEDLDYAGKTIAVIGSGATAMTLVPAMAATAAHVTMVQRSPSYVVSRSTRDRLAVWAHRRLPAGIADALVRWKDVLVGAATYRLARRWPKLVRRAILAGVHRGVGPDHDVETNFSPPYQPWDQRICLIPDGDLFSAIRSGKVSVVTGAVETFTATGLRLTSGKDLAADVIVSATGLVLKLMGGMEIVVDGKRADLADALVYKGMMFSDIPNLALAFGYINASWTLKCDLTARTVCRLLGHMDRHGYSSCVPRLRDTSIGREPMLDFTSGYVRRAIGVLPLQGTKAPWRVHHNYLLDMLSHRFGPVEDGVLEFGNRGTKEDPT